MESRWGRIAGKVALVTGAARGQGRSHAVRLAEEGADVIVVDSLTDVPGAAYPMATAADLEQTVKAVEALDRRVVARQVDVRDLDGLRAAVDEAVAELGRLDVVCANAGICIPGAWDEITPAVWQATLDTNLTGVWHTIAVTAPHLVRAGGGSIVCTGSTAGVKGVPFMVPYVAAKHGLVGVAKAMANELGPHGIRVNVVHPSGVETTMTEGLGRMMELISENPALGAAAFTNALPVERLQPSEITDAVLFLASDESRHVTGTELKVDAGNTNL
ncbi:mycofactocin-coupled SDR family oxidoreductase [Pseudonocardia sp. RS010]|uniref:mycofactocin-coupled SDR family oxidoreductase n=1 Tax=Pseudonocardia sp. RS010 TaxID=3385979 RepID=UPI0039A36979